MMCEFKIWIDIAKSFSKGSLPHFVFPPKMYEGARFSIPLPTRVWGYNQIFNLFLADRLKKINSVLVCFSSMMTEVVCLLICLLAFFPPSFFGECPLPSFSTGS